MRRKLDAHPREIENCRNPPNLMVVRHYGLEVERIKQLTLLTLAPPHHRNSPSMADSPLRNHGSLCSSRQFCNKIGHERKWIGHSITSSTRARSVGSSLIPSAPRSTTHYEEGRRSRANLLFRFLLRRRKRPVDDS